MNKLYNFILRSSFLLFFCYLTINSIGQTINTLNYNVDDGLPQSQVFCLSDDDQGFLWVGTQGGGVSKFDGINFKTPVSEHPFEDHFINTLLKNKNGKIFIGTNKNLYIYDSGRYTKILLKQSGETNITALVEDTLGQIWVGTTEGLFIYDPIKKKTTTVAGLPHPKQPIKCIKDINGTLFIGTGLGLYTFNKIWQHIDKSDGLISNKVNDVAKIDQSTIWIACASGGISILDIPTFKIHKEINPLIINEPTCLLPIEDKIYVGTKNKGLYIYHKKDQIWQNYNESKGLTHNNVKILYEDQWDNVWIGSSGGGLSKILEQNFIHYDAKNGLLHPRVYALANDHDEGLWLAAGNHGLYHKQGENFELIDATNGFMNVKCRALHTDQQDRLWIGTANNGLFYKDRDSTNFISLEDTHALPGKNIRSIIEDEKGDIWAAIFNVGIVQIRRLDSTQLGLNIIDKSDGLNDLAINTLVRQSSDKIWFGTYSGELGIIKNGEIGHIYSKKEGLPPYSIRSIAISPNGQIWIGMAGAGLYKSDNSKGDLKFKPFAGNKDLNSRNIYLMTFDKLGHLWVGHEKGVDEILYPDSPERSTYRKYGKDEGFKGIETCQNAILENKDGLWFGTLGGLTKTTPTATKKNTKAPILHFEEISINNAPLDLIDSIVLSNPTYDYRHNNFGFSLQGTHLNKPHDLDYNYKLEGLDDTWRLKSKNTQILYSNLKPGKYIFKSKACVDTNCSPIKTFAFSISRPFWQSYWFYLGISIALIFTIGWIIRRRIKKLEQQSRLAQEKLTTENEILKLEQKARQLQMNPHFIFNALNSIQSLMAIEDGSSARQQLNKFAQLMRNILNQSKMDYISLEEEIKSLKTYLDIEQYCRPDKFEYKITFQNNTKTSIDDIEFPPMLLQPFVENAVIHGVSHLATKGQINIAFELNGKLLTCRIKDNGVGRKRASILKAQKGNGHQSISMEVTQERLKNIKGTSRYVPFEIRDILNEAQEVVGTQTTLIIMVK